MNTSTNKVLYGVIAVAFLLVLVVLGLYAYQQYSETETDTTSDTGSEVSNGNSTTDEEEQVSTTSYESEKGVDITVISPERGATVSSPLSVSGSVPGSWSHEGQFTVRLLDQNSNVLAEGPATLDGDWMTTSPVPFTASLTFEAPTPGTMGLLVLEKANPSDLAENSDSLSVPLQF